MKQTFRAAMANSKVTKERTRLSSALKKKKKRKTPLNFTKNDKKNKQKIWQKKQFKKVWSNDEIVRKADTKEGKQSQNNKIINKNLTITNNK